MEPDPRGGGWRVVQAGPRKGAVTALHAGEFLPNPSVQSSVADLTHVSEEKPFIHAVSQYLPACAPGRGEQDTSFLLSSSSYETVGNIDEQLTLIHCDMVLQTFPNIMLFQRSEYLCFFSWVPLPSIKEPGKLD